PCGKARISSIRHRFQRLSQRKGQVTHVLLTRSPLIHQVQAPSFSVRLACVKHAASVRPEPGSNSPYKAINTTHTTQHGTRSIKNPYKKNPGKTTTPTRGMRAAIKPIKKLASITTKNTLLSSQTTNAHQHKTPTQGTPHQGNRCTLPSLPCRRQR